MQSNLIQEYQIYPRLTLGACTICRECIKISCCKWVSQVYRGQVKRKESRQFLRKLVWNSSNLGKTKTVKHKHSEVKSKWGQMSVIAKDEGKRLWIKAVEDWCGERRHVCGKHWTARGPKLVISDNTCIKHI